MQTVKKELASKWLRWFQSILTFKIDVSIKRSLLYRRNLNWLSTQELKCPLDESSQEVRDLLNDSIHDILEVDGKMAPQDKLDCIVR